MLDCPVLSDLTSEPMSWMPASRSSSMAKSYRARRFSAMSLRLGFFWSAMIGRT